MKIIIQYITLLIFLNISANVYSQIKTDSTNIIKDKTEKKQTTSKFQLTEIHPVYLVERNKQNKGTKESFLKTLSLFIPLIQTFIWILLIGLIYFIGRRKINDLLEVLTDRIKKGSSLEAGPFKVGEDPKLITNTKEFAEYKLDEKIYGNPDHFKTLFKVVTNDLKKSTKAMELENGCLVQVTTERKSDNGKWDIAENLTFVPNASIEKDDISDYAENTDKNLIGYHLKFTNTKK